MILKIPKFFVAISASPGMRVLLRWLLKRMSNRCRAGLSAEQEMLEFIGGLIGRRDASERFPRTCVAEERARFYIFQSWRDPLLRCPSCP